MSEHEESSVFEYEPALPIVEVQVGNSDPPKFFLHRAPLTQNSIFFQNALKEGSPWIESETDICTLSEDDPELFKLYSQILYFSELPQYMPKKRDGYITTDKKFINLARLYVLCEKLQDEKAKKLVAHTFEEVLHKFPCLLNCSEIACIYDGTPELSPMRKMLAGCIAYHQDGVWLKLWRHKLPEDFIFDFAVERAAKNQRPASSE